MRKLNSVLAMGTVVLFLVHAAVGGLQLAGLLPGGSRVMTILAWAMVAFIALHTLIGIKLTADTLSAMRKSGAGYFRENKLFWVRRISGAAVMLFIVSHIVLFMGETYGGVFGLSLFDGVRLAGQILLVLSAAVHIITNIKPMMISFGIKNGRELSIDILLILSGVLVLAGAGFVVYYIRWRIF